MQVVEQFSILNPTTPVEIDSQLLLEKSNILHHEYENDLSPSYPLQNADDMLQRIKTR